MRRIAFWRTLRDGSWLTPERLRVYPALVGGAFALAVLMVVLTGHGNLDRLNQPIGVDFSGVWVAGREVRAGHPALPYDNRAHAAAQAAAFATRDIFLPWPYPPYFLLVAQMLAGLPYLVALALWEGGTLVLYLAAVLRACRGAALKRRDILIAALAFPAVAVNILHGQNGFLSAGLVALGAFLLPRRPLVAGVLLGLLAYKPQFALAVPVAMLVGGYWLAATAAAVTVALTTLGTWLAYGLAPWLAFWHSLDFTRRVILEGGGLESFKLQSVFGAVRLVGGSVRLAYVAQTTTSFCILASLALVWRGRTDHRLKVAALILASLLSTPYALDYDMTMLGPVLAALLAYGVSRDFAPGEKNLLVIAWLMPLVARATAMTTGVPIGCIVLLVLYAHTVRRALGSPVLAARRPGRPSHSQA